MSSQVYDRVTRAILERLESGTVPWHQPWHAEGAPQNLVSRKHYRGVNVFLLNMQPFESPYWVSFKQARDLGGCVRKGERATPVVFWKWYEKEDAEDDPRRVPVLRYYSVFNVEQCDGIEYPEVPPTPEVPPIEAAERIARGYKDGPSVRHAGARASYRPSLDTIQMPPRKTFEGAEEYYSTLFHEMTHSTGHEKRLARKTLMELCPFGTTNYSKEELVAEMGASMLCGQAGIENRTIDQSASYVAGWLKRLLDDRSLIVLAAAQAQKAADHILGLALESDGEGDTSQTAPVREAA